MTSTTLPDDVLWRIFSTNLPEYPIDSSLPVGGPYRFRNITPNCLMTARSTSQVCCNWRRVMLSASNIWANVVDFDELGQYRQAFLWLKAIIQRSGSCGLMLYGGVKNPDSLDGFLQLIQLCWSRVKTIHVHLDIGMQGSNYNFTHHPSWFILNNTPSPMLQYFRLLLGPCGYIPRGRSSYKPRYITLDSRNPSLKHMFVEEASQFAYEADAPILRSLRTLSLSNFNEDDFDDGQGFFPCSVEAFLTLLRGAPLLESIDVGEEALLAVDSIAPIPYQPRLRAVLPNLKHIELEANISECLGLLRHMALNTACGLELRCHIQGESVAPATQLELLYDLICDQFVRHRSFDEETWISFESSPEISIHDIAHSTKHFRFAVWPDEDGQIISPDFMQLLLRPAFDFSSLLYVHLRFPTSERALGISLTDLFAFLQKFPNLRKLAIPWSCFSSFFDTFKLLPLLSSMMVRPTSILPSLEEVIIDFCHAFTKPEREAPAATSILDFCSIFLQALPDSDPTAKCSILKRLDLRSAPASINASIKEANSSGSLRHLDIIYSPPRSPTPPNLWELA